MKFSQIPEFERFLTDKPPTLSFTGVQCDSRRVRPGDLFVALEGHRENGAHYAAAALERGAAAVLAEGAIPEIPSRYLIPIKEGRKALGILAAALNNYPARQLALYAITGTNGKTTTAWLLRELLQASGRSCGLVSTVAIEYAERSIPATRTTPDACELQSTLAAMVAAGCNSAVVEVSSHGIDQQRIATLPFRGAAFTNLSQEHLDYHADMEEYFLTKQRLFTQMATLHPGAAVACCIDSEYGRRLARSLDELPLEVITCGLSTTAALRAEAVSVTPQGTTFTLVLPDGRQRPLKLKLAGRHNVANALCAIALAGACGISCEMIATRLAQLAPRWGRLERVKSPHPATIFVDYAHTDDALRNVLTTLREITRGRLIVVFGCGGNRDRAKRPLMGAVCAALADYLVITADNPRHEQIDEINAQIIAGIPPGTAFMVEPERRHAIRAALRCATQGDVVLIAGKGHEAFQELDGRTIPFDDRQVALEEARCC